MLEFSVFSIDVNGLETPSAGEYSKNRMSNIPLAEPFGMETEEGPRFIESSLVASDTNEKVELLSQESLNSLPLQHAINYQLLLQLQTVTTATSHPT